MQRNYIGLINLRIWLGNPIAIIGQKKASKFGQNHLIFEQAMEKTFGPETSASPPPNQTRPGRTPTKLVPAVRLRPHTY